jgi:hypothetical protein
LTSTEWRNQKVTRTSKIKLQNRNDKNIRATGLEPTNV